MAITLDDQIACAKRELDMRKAIYPKMTTRGKMLQGKMDHEIAAMDEIVFTLKRVKSGKGY